MMRFTYLNRTTQHSHTSNPNYMMDRAFCFTMQHRNAPQHSNEIKLRACIWDNEKQNKRVLFYECI